MKENQSKKRPLMPMLNEKYGYMRKRCETLWDHESLVRMSASEWYVLYEVQGERKSISDIARAVDITRQAAHKYVHALQEKGLLEVEEHSERRGRYASLSPLGERCLAEYTNLQWQMEKQIERSLGETEMQRLKDLLRKDWFEPA